MRHGTATRAWLGDFGPRARLGDVGPAGRNGALPCGGWCRVVPRARCFRPGVAGGGWGGGRGRAEVPPWSRERGPRRAADVNIGDAWVSPGCLAPCARVCVCVGGGGGGGGVGGDRAEPRRRKSQRGPPRLVGGEIASQAVSFFDRGGGITGQPSLELAALGPANHLTRVRAGSPHAQR